MILSNIKQIAKNNLKTEIVDCCIGIPVYFTDLERRAVLDAAAIVNLNPLCLLHETTATTLAYGIYKIDLSEMDPLNVIFVDIGHASMHHYLQIGNPRFEMIRHDVVEPLLLEVDLIYHLACPASPVPYKFNPGKTIKTNVVGTLNILGLAKRVGAKFFLTSTSEVYGDPLQHPQVETYWGNVNLIGVRSCYFDEDMRTAETLAMDYQRGENVEVRIARIFNTYGPRMCIDDGRVVSNFVAQGSTKNVGPYRVAQFGQVQEDDAGGDRIALTITHEMKVNYNFGSWRSSQWRKTRSKWILINCKVASHNDYGGLEDK
ncbi:hypothetical protein KI387_042211 [Taxus chinensis]|uniref:UDP-glucuronic acid decarboxylase 1 n=1 Tax=Taxus chinensis TaxID=29808 RepID=A0AA38F944_TAXCH|nr:hypothetical protein KI387_042211 [Taxus chinensis]